MTVTRRAEQVMGTVVSVVVRGAVAPAVLDEVFTWFRWVDGVFSPYRADSAISRLGRDECGLDDCPAEVATVLAACEELRSKSDGYFDVTADPRWPLDPCGYVKGWSAEVASRRLAAAGAVAHCINAGGDVRVASPGGQGHGHGWRVGLAHPLRAGAITVAVDLDNGAVATSGTYERGFHVWDPHRGCAALDLAAVTVVGADLGTADAYATAALAMGHDAPDWLATLDGFDSLVVDAGGRAWWTPGLAARAVGLPTAA